MRILVLGATGFIGSRVTQKLLSLNHEVTIGIRDTTQVYNLFPTVKVIICNFRKDTHESIWITRLNDIDVVINCVGVFYHPQKKMIWQIHYETPCAIFKAAEKTGVKLVIHVSALNVEKNKGAYAESKKAAEDCLLARQLSAIILKPSIVYGDAAGGSIDLFQKLASIPFLLPIPGDGNQSLQPIHVDDLVTAMINLMNAYKNEKITLAAVSENPITIKNMLIIIRDWLHYPRAHQLAIPLWLIKPIALIGNLMPDVKINTDALTMLANNNTASLAETTQFHKTINFIPRDFASGVYSQNNYRSTRAYTLIELFNPLLRISLAIMWLVTALTSAFIFPRISSYERLVAVGIPSSWSASVLNIACILNFVIGLGLLLNYKSKWNYALQFIIVLIYSLIIIFRLPMFLTEPFGPIIKNLPLLILIGFLFCLEDDK